MLDLTTVCNDNLFNKDKQDTLLKNNNIIKKNLILNDNMYSVLCYDKEYLNKENYDTIGKFRSIVLKNNQVMCYSPEKSLTYEEFIKKKVIILLWKIL